MTGVVRRKIGFILASTDHGTMILNRFDYRMVAENQGYGVGLQLLDGSSFDPQEIQLALILLELRRKYFGDGVIAIDCGANIGVHTVEWAKKMTGWGAVVAIEPQERIYYALAGNITINNCFNAKAIHAVIAAERGIMKIPSPDYLRAASFGSLELRKGDNNEFIGQPIDYAAEKMVDVPAITLDSLNLARLDFIKIDVEGMELEVLQGASASIDRHRPILVIETIKSDKAKLDAWLTQRDYRIFTVGINILAIHSSDRSALHFREAAAPS